MKAWGARIAIAWALSTAMPAAGAANRDALLQKAELTMLVRGSIDMRPDGSVDRYAIDHADKIPAAVQAMIGEQVSQWKFEPVLVAGVPVAARTKMSLRIVAKPRDEDSFDVRIQGARFSGGNEAPDERMEVLKKTSLSPMVSAMAWTRTSAADLYLALKIGPDGKVLDGIVGQVNLTAYGSDRQMAWVRKALGDAALGVVRKWTFSVPTRGELAGQPYWSGILPVTFRMQGGSTPPAETEGQWQAYFPGPCTPVPWRVLEQDGGGSGRCDSDAAPEGTLSLDGSGPRLLTPLMQG